MTTPPTSSPAPAARAYEAAGKSAVLIDMSRRARIRVTGRDRIDLLQRLTTNDMKAIAPGQGVANLFLTNKGRIVELADILAFPEHLLVILGSEAGAQGVEWIERYVFMEDVKAEDVTAETSMLGVFGPQAGTILAAATGIDVAEIGEQGQEPARIGARDYRPGRLGGIQVVVGSAEPIAGAGFRVLGSRADAAAIAAAISAAGAPAGLQIGDAATLDVLRIEAGWPGAGRELSEHWNPLEAELRWAVSFTKGCYTGQEVVARLNTYKKVQRTLRGLVIAGDQVPAAEAKVRQGATEVGVVTSAAQSPGVGSVIALAYIDLAQSAPGTALMVEMADGGTAGAEVVPLPFPGSGGRATPEPACD
jgi:folate-binding protein YgfZ